ncbi:bis(5'-nucleosyl)-tetraphosphatase (symmetrical) YqeK [Colibacter massiliensis]|uniref:bis(5'-nucleosyl)-tetraphosphatase (symmetrical) YqeK n=1 Tax=Colibacter massiliensis TaxID=1852379 RepID=UPI002356FE4E|nr:bis(5'-nucleosyl)-tetraphosphatase (symmetrical) YqeK [Colibacter massiliensis]
MLDAAFKDKVKADMKERLSAKRYTHTLGVAEAAVKLAYMYGIDIDKAETAALLHDAEKEDSLEHMQSLADSMYGDSLAPEIQANGNLLHGYAAASYAAMAYDIFDKDILNAIAHHTTGAESMSPLEKVIFLADYIEDNRDFPGVEKLRKAAEKSLNKGVLAGYDMTIQYLLQEGKTIFIGTVRNRNALLREMKHKGGY